MRIAYCFGGHVRTFEQCWPTFQKHIYSKAPGDIFFHTWNERTSTGPSWWKPEGSEKQPLPRDELLKLVNPKAFMIEESRSLVPIKANHWVKQSGWSCKNAYEAGIKSFTMARQYDKYDIFFIMRFDLFLQGDINLQQLEDKEYLYTAKHPHFNNQGCYSDVFTHGTEDFTEKRLNWFFHLDSKVFLDQSGDISHEYEMSKYFHSVKLPAKVSSLEYALLRDTGQLQNFY